MLKIVQAAVVAACLVLGACSTTALNSFVSQLQGDIAVIQPAVSSITQTACGFIPTIDTIAGIISANNPVVTSVDDVATAICKSLVSATSGARVANPRVGAVTVHGKFKDGTTI